MWVNGENYANMKLNDLTWGSFATTLPNARHLQNSESQTMDFSVPVEGPESPWGGAQLVFIYDSVVVENHVVSRLINQHRARRRTGADGAKWQWELYVTEPDYRHPGLTTSG